MEEYKARARAWLESRIGTPIVVQWYGGFRRVTLHGLEGQPYYALGATRQRICTDAGDGEIILAWSGETYASGDVLSHVRYPDAHDAPLVYFD